MDDCPPEILLLIFDLACADGGATARALSLTSRYISAVAAPYVHRTLEISGISSIERAYAHLSTLPAEHRRVHHLFVSDKQLRDSVPDAHLVAPDPESLASVELHEALHRSNAAEARVLPDLLDRLLRLLAPSLRTLSCVLFNPLQSAVFVRLCAVPFPFLTDLTLRLSERILMPPPPAAPAMPRLRRLHFASSRYLSTTAAPVLALFAAACPLLARLRLSDLRLMPGCAAALCRMLGRDPVRDQYGWMPSAASLDRVARLPARVRAVVVQLEDLEAKGFGGFEAHLVQSVADADGADGFVLLPRAPRRTYEQWAEDWAAVAHGDYSAWEAVCA